MALPVCTIDENGIHKPDYEEARAYFVEAFQGIFGQDIYVDPDSQDGQHLAILSSAVNDANAMAVEVYNSFSPSSGRGAGLSSIVKINGIKRRVASFSTVDLLITGQAGTTITDGVATDGNGNRWALPASVTIPPDGDIVVTATSKALGAVTAAANTITTIGTPTRGWQDVTNPAVATPGAPVENDAQLRIRQSVSTAIPSLTVFEGTMGAVASILGVSRYRGYENDSDATDSDGIPGHTISIVVDGGDAQAIGEAIAAKKAPGTGTFGTTSVDVIDEYGVTRAIKFFRPTSVGIKAEITLTPRQGYSAVIEAQIKQTVVDYINAIRIGDDVVRSKLYLPANLFGGTGSQSFDIGNLQIAKLADPLGTADIAIAFNQAAAASIANISIVS
ncbi:Bacteriophage protein [Bosea sp. 62]|uniref:baseplate J/gp47 family protein n=1 Tax=unclassified Bosea (in: a-proteobacteria) TaxID=2653178 RepID=UPI0012511972|nr:MULTISPECIES: baseplate J/gp47 family protein [unclassified Bosea (in: a-proteobacteria)]CAD5254451.1 Bacteriophage protein [Bosea sp. 7B]CAD5276562.1 Bacteriophage protein [Bosea sp. 21B]CAD5277721.1 Bacteriophage protein [Bosea sp. 46]VVT59865.1 Bacteriophage protein [Bosea sp. EC-HK365B]VXB46541.1 Bacteriophage protein [Bosea sp. 62]